jgi:conjugative relaxase-like TrwC/TraI family protein
MRTKLYSKKDASRLKSYFAPPIPLNQPPSPKSRLRYLYIAGKGAQLLRPPQKLDVCTAMDLLVQEYLTVENQKIQIVRKNQKIYFYGLIMTVDKSVSLLLAHTQKYIREAVLIAFETAIHRVIETIEQLAIVRLGAGGTRAMKALGLVTLYQIHLTAADGAPHLHGHVFIKSNAPCADGRWRTLDSNLMLGLIARIADAFLQCVLLQELRQRLGDEIYASMQIRGSRVVVGIAGLEAFRERFSKRRKEVLHQVEQNPKLKDRPAARTYKQDCRAWQKTRWSKGDDGSTLDWHWDEGHDDQVAAKWRKQGVLNFDTLELKAQKVNKHHQMVSDLLRLYKPKRDEIALKLYRLICMHLDQTMRRWTLSDVAAFICTAQNNKSDIKQTINLTSQLYFHWIKLGLIRSKHVQVPTEILHVRVSNGQADTLRLRRSWGLGAYLITMHAMKKEQDTASESTLLYQTFQKMQQINPEELPNEPQKAPEIIAPHNVLTAASKPIPRRPTLKRASQKAIPNFTELSIFHDDKEPFRRRHNAKISVDPTQELAFPHVAYPTYHYPQLSSHIENKHALKQHSRLQLNHSDNKHLCHKNSRFKGKVIHSAINTKKFDKDMEI